MPLLDDLRGIADRAHAELDSVHDFLEHSKIVPLQPIVAGFSVKYFRLSNDNGARVYFAGIVDPGMVLPVHLKI